MRDTTVTERVETKGGKKQESFQFFIILTLNTPGWQFETARVLNNQYGLWEVRMKLGIEAVFFFVEYIGHVLDN